MWNQSKILNYEFVPFKIWELNVELEVESELSHHCLSHKRCDRHGVTADWSLIGFILCCTKDIVLRTTFSFPWVDHWGFVGGGFGLSVVAGRSFICHIYYFIWFMARRRQSSSFALFLVSSSCSCLVAELMILLSSSSLNNKRLCLTEQSPLGLTA